jgi:hypothetical protein
VSGVKNVKDLEGSGSGLILLLPGNFPSVTEEYRASVRRVDVPVEIRTEDVPNKNEERYHYVTLLCS